MSSNFDLLSAEWPELFAEAVLAEREAFADPRISCFYARRTLELAVAWLYDADATLNRPYKDDLSARLYEPTFRALVGNGIQMKCDIVRKQGNTAVHKMTPIPTNAAVDVLRELFHVLYWVAKHYTRNPGDLPATGITFDTSLIRRPEPASVRVRTQAQLLKLAEDLAAKDAPDRGRASEAIRCRRAAGSVAGEVRGGEVRERCQTRRPRLRRGQHP